MNKFFYSRMAVSNIRKNKNIYLPYLLAGTLIVALFYILSSITTMVQQSPMEGGSTMSVILLMSTVICGFFALNILFYINSFIIKRRKKEFGLYSILGMEKRHISIVMFWEVIITGMVSVVCGIVGGALLSQLLFLLLLKIIKLPAALTFQIPLSSVVTTAVLFGVGFAATLVYDVISIMRTDPIALLHSAKQGEKEPKARWLLTLFGLLALGGGYLLSWTVRTPSEAVAVFLLAVLLVIIGTYCLFISGSIVLLKFLRKNKKYYYKPKNFISVSGMIYRMKQNAAGLATICILSTSVLVTLSSTVCLFIGEEDILRVRFDRQVHANCIADTQSAQLMQGVAEAHAQDHGFTVVNDIGYYSFSFPGYRSGDRFDMIDQYGNQSFFVEVLALEDYNRITGLAKTLKEGEALVCAGENPLGDDTITLGEKAYQVKGSFPRPDYLGSLTAGDEFLVVLPKLDDLTSLRDTYNSVNDDDHHRSLWYDLEYDVSGDGNLSEFYGTMRDAYTAKVEHISIVDNIDSARTDFYQLYGSLMFVGIFFVMLFLIATVLIIYYKQVTEGYDDHDRFQIMQKVGLSDKEVRSTIQKQVLLVFFLPLGTAVLHIVVAFRVLCKLLLVFNMTNTLLFLLCTFGAALAFAVLYFVVYQLTARTYYRIVQAKA